VLQLLLLLLLLLLQPATDLEEAVLLAPAPCRCLTPADSHTFVLQLLLLLLLQPATDLEEAVLQGPVPADALTPPDVWVTREQLISGRTLKCDCCQAALASVLSDEKVRSAMCVVRSIML
jgi:hypothetical protein